MLGNLAYLKKHNLYDVDLVMGINGTDARAGAITKDITWPILRHYNKKTGFGGELYQGQNDGTVAVCKEMGPTSLGKTKDGINLLYQYIEDRGSTIQCNIKQEWKDCTKEQSKFVEQFKDKTKDELEGQVNRLTGMLKSIKGEALGWVQQRMSIVKQLLRKDELLKEAAESKAEADAASAAQAKAQASADSAAAEEADHKAKKLAAAAATEGASAEAKAQAEDAAAASAKKDEL